MNATHWNLFAIRPSAQHPHCETLRGGPSLQPCFTDKETEAEWSWNIGSKPQSPGEPSLGILPRWVQEESWVFPLLKGQKLPSLPPKPVGQMCSFDPERPLRGEAQTYWATEPRRSQESEHCRAGDSGPPRTGWMKHFRPETISFVLPLQAGTTLALCTDRHFSDVHPT